MEKITVGYQNIQSFISQQDISATCIHNLYANILIGCGEWVIDIPAT